MSRRSDRDRPLLAGRVKPTRTPPLQAVGPKLRLSRHDVPPTVEQVAPTLASALRTAVYAGRSLHRALGHYGSMISRLEMAEVEASRCLHGDPADLVQRRIDALLMELDALCNSEAKDRRALFDGAWSTPVVDHTGVAVATVMLPIISLASLGSDGIGGRLDSLFAQRENCLDYVGPATVLAVLRSAILWVAAERERVFRVLADVIEPLVGELEVIEANASATSDASNSEFCASVAEISKLTIMSQTQRSAAAAQPAVDASNLRISHANDE